MGRALLYGRYHCCPGRARVCETFILLVPWPRLATLRNVPTVVVAARLALWHPLHQPHLFPAALVNDWLKPAAVLGTLALLLAGFHGVRQEIHGARQEIHGVRQELRAD